MDLFQRFPGPRTPNKNMKNRDLGVLGVGSPTLGGTPILPKQCLHSRVPGGFSSDSVRGVTGCRRVCVRHVCVLFMVLRPCRLRFVYAKWSSMASNTEKHNGFHDFPLPGPTWPHMPSRCSPDGPRCPQMAPNSTVWILALESCLL